MYTHKHTNFTLRAKFLSYRIKKPAKADILHIYLP